MVNLPPAVHPKQLRSLAFPPSLGELTPGAWTNVGVRGQRDPVSVANSGRREECPRRSGSHSQPPPVWLEVLADLRGTLGAVRHFALASDAREVRTAIAAVGA
jgi:hypothetical protein